MKRLLAAVLGCGLCGASALWAAPPKPRNNAVQMSADMREAIAFQRAKDAADARQARLEARHPSVPPAEDENGANRVATPSSNRHKVVDPGPAQWRRDHSPE